MAQRIASNVEQIRHTGAVRILGAPRKACVLEVRDVRDDEQRQRLIECSAEPQMGIGAAPTHVEPGDTRMKGLDEVVPGNQLCSCCGG